MVYFLLYKRTSAATETGLPGIILPYWNQIIDHGRLALSQMRLHRKRWWKQQSKISTPDGSFVLLGCSFELISHKVSAEKYLTAVMWYTSAQ